MVPPDRSAHTSVVYKDNMYILGGWDGSVSNNDFYMYNFESRMWAEVEYTGISPPCIRSHAAVVYKDSMVVFGGYGDVHPTNIYIFHFPSKHWEVIHPRIPSVSVSSSSKTGDVLSFSTDTVPNPALPPLPSSPTSPSSLPSSPAPSTTPFNYNSIIGPAGGPCGRSRFRMVYYQESLWIFGGWDRRSYFADLWRFRLDTLTWHCIETNFDLKGVGQHSLVVYQGYMYLYGGYCADSKAPHPSLYLYKLPPPSSYAGGSIATFNPNGNNGKLLPPPQPREA